MINTIFDIQLKEDSVERLSAVSNKDPKNILFASEFNMVVSSVIKLIPKGIYVNNTAAIEAGLEDGDIYYLPNQNDNNILAIVKAPKIIELEDVNGDVFTSLLQARDYVKIYTDALITNESFIDGVYRFSVPFGSDFSLSNGFCSFYDDGSRLKFVDQYGTVIKFGDNAFRLNEGNNVFGNVVFGNNCFLSSTGNNILGNCIFGDSCFSESTGNNLFLNTTAGISFFNKASGNNIFKNVFTAAAAFTSTTGIYHFKNIILKSNHNFTDSSGVYYFEGNIGDSEDCNFETDFFDDNNGATIHALAYKETSNNGDMEGDLKLASAHGVNIIFDL